VVQTCNLSSWEAEAESCVEGQPRLHNKTLSQKQKKRKKLGEEKQLNSQISNKKEIKMKVAVNEVNEIANAKIKENQSMKPKVCS
jgi:hypothetical protein